MLYLIVVLGDHLCLLSAARPGNGLSCDDESGGHVVLIKP